MEEFGCFGQYLSLEDNVEDSLEEPVKRSSKEDELTDLLRRVVRIMYPNSYDSDGLKKTPERVAKFLAEISSVPEYPELTLFDNPGISRLVEISNIQFASICEHHFLPFYGEVSVAYMPDLKIVGLSKVPRLVDYFAKAATTQEKLCVSILRSLHASDLRPRATAVKVKATHSCMEVRGVRKSAVTTVFETAGFQYDAISNFLNRG